ncbi:DUF1479-domain-containing protein [Irpex rosettiformis]|uniref:DUF1479-domain-containing protein n=1 Tax=Irpex rosettiformis TaxID=378272 RepID=A0ACB8TSE6_9APHY|nr:DUF1479-domain-containing protein [Irpex rosettiformis]
MMHGELIPLPARFAELKQQIAASVPGFEHRVTQAWGELLKEMKGRTDEIATRKTDVIPQVRFDDLQTLNAEVLENIRRRGCVVIRNVVDEAESQSWKEDLKTIVAENPVIGMPEDQKQFFMLYWTKPQVLARAHPNVLAASKWMNNLYHVKGGAVVDGVDLSTPLSYADRFRIRLPGSQWHVHPPHVDGGSIERWEDESFRQCFIDILNGRWKEHDPYDLGARINARTTLYGKPNQASVFRAFQGWLALSNTSPGEGTLQVFPDVFLSNAYLILRPFFKPIAEAVTDVFSPAFWKFDISDADFPGIYAQGDLFLGPAPNPFTHPHLQLEKTMISVPTVRPGDMVFWHCDLIHAVETEHKGEGDSSVLYIPAVPHTPSNAAYIAKQKESFLQGIPPPDYPFTGSEAGFKGVGTIQDILPFGRTAMGFDVEVAA